jgi:hypothetical protein
MGQEKYHRRSNHRHGHDAKCLESGKKSELLPQKCVHTQAEETKIDIERRNGAIEHGLTSAGALDC